VDVLLPDNPKLDGLSPAAKWTLVELWCHCGQHLTDGFVRDAKWSRFGNAAIRRKIVENGLATRVEGGYRMHDYLDHQRSRAEVEEVRAKRSEAGKRSAAARAKAKALAQQDVEHGAEQTVQQTGSKPATEAEAEAEADKSLMAEPHDHLSVGNLPRDVTDSIIDEISKVTGRTVSRPWAATIGASILAGRDPADPAAYVRTAIRSERDPRTRFLPVAASHPSARTPTEAAFAAGIIPNGRPADDQTVAAIAAQVRQAIRKGSS
jgi:hypothetical protein